MRKHASSATGSIVTAAILAGLAGLTAGCGAGSARTKPAPAPTETPSAQPTAEPPDSGTTPITRGEAVYRHFCARCHIPPDPSVHQRGEWYRNVLKMQDYAKYAGQDTLSRQDLFAVSDYLDAHASPGKNR